jgi:hypothetical protein
MLGSGNHLEDRLDAEMSKKHIPGVEYMCLDCLKVNCTCDDDYDSREVATADDNHTKRIRND